MKTLTDQELKALAKMHGYKLVKDDSFCITDDDVCRYLLSIGFSTPEEGINALSKLPAIAYMEVLLRVANQKLPVQVRDSKDPWYVVSRINGNVCAVPANASTKENADMVTFFETEAKAEKVISIIKAYLGDE